jgi:hypothetical protein
MSPKIERWMFRLGLVGCLVVLGLFGYELIVDPGVPIRAEASEPPTPPSTTTTTTTAPPTTVPATWPFVAMSPRDETRVALSSVLVTGVGTPGAVVNGAGQTTNVDARGVWAVRIPLIDGTNELELVEQAPDGAEQQLRVTVHFEPIAASSTTQGEVSVVGSTPASPILADDVPTSQPVSETP